MKPRHYHSLAGDLLWDTVEIFEKPKEEVGSKSDMYLDINNKDLPSDLAFLCVLAHYLYSKRTSIITTNTLKQPKNSYKYSLDEFKQILKGLPKLCSYYGHRFSPQVQCLIDFLQDFDIHKFALKFQYRDIDHGLTLSKKEEFVTLLNTHLNQARERLKDKRILAKQANLRRNCNKQYASMKELILHTLDISNEVLILRVDLKYKISPDDILESDGNEIFVLKENNPSTQITSHFEKLLQNKEGNRFFEHLLGYCWRLEKGLSYYIHSIWIFDSQHKKDDVKLTEQLNTMWQKVTNGKGVARDWRKRSTENITTHRKRIGVGLLHKDDLKAQEKLFKALHALCQKDLMARALSPNKGRCFGRSSIPKKDIKVRVLAHKKLLVQPQPLQRRYTNQGLNSIKLPWDALYLYFSVVSFIKEVKGSKSLYINKKNKPHPRNNLPKKQTVADLLNRFSDYKHPIQTESFLITLNAYHPYITLFREAAMQYLWINGGCIIGRQETTAIQQETLFKAFIKNVRKQSKSATLKRREAKFQKEVLNSQKIFLMLLSKHRKDLMICVDLWDKEANEDEMTKHLKVFLDNLVSYMAEKIKAYLGKTYCDVYQRWHHFMVFFCEPPIDSCRQTYTALITELWQKSSQQKNSVDELCVSIGEKSEEKEKDNNFNYVSDLNQNQESILGYLLALSSLMKIEFPKEYGISSLYWKELKFVKQENES